MVSNHSPESSQTVLLFVSIRSAEQEPRGSGAQASGADQRTLSPQGTEIRTEGHSNGPCLRSSPLRPSPSSYALLSIRLSQGPPRSDTTAQARYEELRGVRCATYSCHRLYYSVSWFVLQDPVRNHRGLVWVRGRSCLLEALARCKQAGQAGHKRPASTTSTSSERCKWLIDKGLHGARSDNDHYGNSCLSPERHSSIPKGRVGRGKQSRATCTSRPSPGSVNLGHQTRQPHPTAWIWRTETCPATGVAVDKTRNEA